MEALEVLPLLMVAQAAVVEVQQTERLIFQVVAGVQDNHHKVALLLSQEMGEVHY
jgi:hypothetical protein